MGFGREDNDNDKAEICKKEKVKLIDGE